ncbi:carbohydrate ABC transporter permease [Chloroflexi bacterium TSY]|nr:carbohydrate ABC transporter permease [Chloroflexi bacterium TSY]
MMRRSILPVLGRITLYLVLFGCGFFLLIPFFWMLSTAVKPEVQVFLFPPKWIPEPVLWQNFVDVVTPQPQHGTLTQYVGMPFATNLANTSLIVVANIAGSLFSCSLAAFGFARLRARAKNILFILVLSTMMLPWQVILIPQFILFKTLQWTNSFLPLTVPAFFGNAFYIFLLRQFFSVIPRELDDAARIDGCHTFQIFSRILLPLCKPALITVAIFSFMTHWNDFLGPLIYLDSPDKFTLALGLRQFQSMYGVKYNYLMAASTLVLLPPLAVFFMLQKYFIQGVVIYSFKG